MIISDINTLWLQKFVKNTIEELINLESNQKKLLL